MSLICISAPYLTAVAVPATRAVPAATVALAAPSLEAKPSLVGAITLTWTKVDGATGYALERSFTGAAETFAPLKTLGAGETSYRDTDLYYSQKAYYRIKAVGGSDSPYSKVASATTHAKDHTFKVMPLGDSNTEGGTANDPASAKASYRARLEDLLKEKNIKFDYVGSESTGSSLVADTDHAGFGGSRNEDLVTIIQNGWYDRWYDGKRFGLDHTENYLEYYKPDIILLHSGTNDISNDGVDNSQQTVEDLTQVLEEIDKYEQRSGREVTVVVAKIIKTVCTATDCYRGPVNTKNDIIDKYNAKIGTLVNNRTKAGDRLVLVDMTDANIIYQFAADGGDMADRFHPTQRGYDKMAPVWFKVLEPLLNRTLKQNDTEAPETTIASKPKELSNSSTARFEFSSNESGVTFQVSIDGGNFASAATPYTTASLADGEHTIRVRAIDAAGNIDATPASYTWSIDTKAPAAPVVVAPEEGKLLRSNKPSITGTAEAGSMVNVYVGSTKVGTATAGSDGKWELTPANALAEGTQQLTARATDLAGNTSQASGTRTFTVDTKAPETTIAAGPPKVSNSSQATFTFSSNEQSVSYEVSVDGGAYTGSGSSFTARNLSEGNHTLSVRATDGAGNTDQTPATYSWEVDTKAPEAPVFAGLSEDRGPVADDQVTADNTLRFFGRAEAGAEVAISERSKVLGKTEARADGTWEFSHENVSLQQGEYTFTATATDAAGNASEASKGFAVTVDLTAPKAEIAGSGGSPTNTPFDISITFTEEVYGFTASDLEVTNAKMESFKATSKTMYTATVVPLADGAVRVKLPAGKATDLAGNPNTASGLLETTYDASAPNGYALAFGVEKVDVDNQTAVSLQVSGAERETSYFYSITSSNGGNPVSGSATVKAEAFTIGNLNLSDLPDGTLTATIYLVDEVGNRGQEVSAQVAKQTKDITAVHHPDGMTVPFKTAFGALGLPEQVTVSYTYGDDEALPVEWSPGDYNSEVPGSYIIIGQLKLKDNTSNSKNMAARMEVTVEPNQPPTALTLSADKFRPDVLPTELIGTFSTTDPDDEAFTYALVGGQGDEDNSLFEIRGDNELYLKSNEGLSGRSVFHIRVRSTDPYANAIEKSFALTKSLYAPEGGIKLVNAFSPDGDNINDTWVVPELRFFNNIQVQVFDRAGVLLFQTTDPEKGWDGRGKDGRIVAGSYFYIIQVKDNNLVQKGVLTVLK
ncbi:Ig-like domain-containing protein [Pontibacter litorisediminis]|uniref:Ig-like domain-containing protein n=1 Tax=Pontibacter litorisediminis TaxID=1846260 RepID=UPI0023EAE874|nr:Ig-like domain-containing protein [Pontibacter litorisediminis]